MNGGLCSGCKVALSEENTTPTFFKRRNGYCHTCINAIRRKRRKEDPEYRERTRLQPKPYKLRNSDKMKAYYLEYYKANRDRCIEQAKKRAHLHPERDARYKRKATYGVTEEKFQDMKISQDYRCAICFEVFVRTPFIDHDHATGKTRDLLCLHCNTVLGYAKDRISVLESAIKYLRKHGEENGERVEERGTQQEGSPVLSYAC